MNLLLENSFRSVGSLRGQHECPRPAHAQASWRRILHACAFVTKKEPARAAEGPLKPWVTETSWESRRPPGCHTAAGPRLRRPLFCSPSGCERGGQPELEAAL